MTTYFDNCVTKILMIRSALLPDATETAIDALNALDKQVVDDVTICAETLGFPADLRTRIHRVILRYSVYGQPQGSTCADADYEDYVTQLTGLDRMCSDLHDLFHELGRRQVEYGDGATFGDGPRGPIYNMIGEGFELRKQMAKEAGMLDE